MARSSEDTKKFALFGFIGLLVFVLGYQVYSALFGGSTAAPAPPVIVQAPAGRTTGREVATPPGNVAAGGLAKKVGTTSGQLDPTLHEEAMLVTESLVYAGTGRNIFAAGAAQEPPKPVKLVAAVAPARPLPPVYVPPPPPPTCPPTCPAIGLKFFGTSTSASGVRVAFLLQGDDVYLASAGDVVQRKYRIVSISANSIVVEDIPNVNKQTLPLVIN